TGNDGGAEIGGKGDVVIFHVGWRCPDENPASIAAELGGMHQPPVFRLPGLCSPAVQFVAIMRPDQAPGLPIKYEETTVSQMKKLLGLLLMAGVMAVSSSAISQQAALTEELKARIAPVGNVCKAGDPCAAAPVA